MTDELRNPYIILGLDFGASRDEARRAFAKVSRRVKQSNSSPYSIEDVTWALHQVEKVHDDPEAAVSIFRVPANPEPFHLAAEGKGLFAPQPESLPRWSQSPTADDVEALAHKAVKELVIRAIDSLEPLSAEILYEISGRNH